MDAYDNFLRKLENMKDINPQALNELIKSTECPYLNEKIADKKESVYQLNRDKKYPNTKN